ncbi:MAG: hypothetical protein M3069_17470 [Chloroflexota bacterium]|nr:hypothetical protein [Chloroflexota bacterium]
MHPGQQKTAPHLPGISAVLATSAGPPELDGAVLELAAVLDGLVYANFEITVVDTTASPRVADTLTELRLRCPTLPVRLQEGKHIGQDAALVAAFDAAAYDLILVTGTTGEFDVRETNHLLEALERGADLAIGYRPRRADGRVRRLYGWGWNVLVRLMFGKTARDVDCPFKLFRVGVWQGVHVRPHEASPTFNTELLVRARRLGFRVAEVPVSHHRLPAGTHRAARPTEIRRALLELGQLHHSLQRECGQSTNLSLPTGRQAA